MADSKQKKKEDMIEIAVRFLMSADVKNATEDQKRNFLKKKGLKDDEIKEAYEKMKVKLAQQEEEKEKEREKEKEKDIKKAKPESQVHLKKKLLNAGELQQKYLKAEKSNILILRNFQLIEIPGDVFVLLNLQVLILSFNILQAIPDEIENLKNLKIFHAVQCELQDYQISDNLWKLNTLQELNLSRNDLIYVDNVPNLTQITILDLSRNSILTLPSNINECQQLKLLNLAHNNISRLPESLKQLQQLQKILLMDNLLDTQHSMNLNELYNQPILLFEKINDQFYQVEQ